MQTIDIEALLSIAKDVTLECGAKHRCIDVTQIYELPKTEIVMCKDCKSCVDKLVFKNSRQGDPLVKAYFCYGPHGHGNRVAPDFYCRDGKARQIGGKKND